MISLGLRAMERDVPGATQPVRRAKRGKRLESMGSPEFRGSLAVPALDVHDFRLLTCHV